MPEFFNILSYDKSEHLDKNGSNLNLWKTQTTAYLKGTRLWSYITGNAAIPKNAELEKLERWEQNDAIALSMMLMNPLAAAAGRTPNATATGDRLIVAVHTAQASDAATAGTPNRTQLPHSIGEGTKCFRPAGTLQESWPSRPS